MLPTSLKLTGHGVFYSFDSHCKARIIYIIVSLTEPNKSGSHQYQESPLKVNVQGVFFFPFLLGAKRTMCQCFIFVVPASQTRLEVINFKSQRVLPCPLKLTGTTSFFFSFSFQGEANIVSALHLHLYLHCSLT